MAADRKSILLRLDPAVHDALARWAAAELRSTNAQIEFLLRQALLENGRLPADAGKMRRPGRPRRDERDEEGDDGGDTRLAARAGIPGRLRPGEGSHRPGHVDRLAARCGRRWRALAFRPAGGRGWPGPAGVGR